MRLGDAFGDAAPEPASATPVTRPPARRRRIEVAPSYLAESRAPGTAICRPGARLGGANDVWLALVDIRGAAQEHFIAFDLNVRHRVIARRVVSIGSISGVEVHPREVFQRAIVNGAAAVILAHNHPSGDPSPSRQDLELTGRLRQVGELCGIAVVDHVVVAAGGFVSLAERGWI